MHQREDVWYAVPVYALVSGGHARELLDSICPEHCRDHLSSGAPLGLREENLSGS